MGAFILSSYQMSTSLHKSFLEPALGDPGLEGRLGSAHAQRFANLRGSLPNGVAYPYGWSHMLREVGLNSVMSRSFLHEFASPLEASQKDYLET